MNNNHHHLLDDIEEMSLTSIHNAGSGCSDGDGVGRQEVQLNGDQDVVQEVDSTLQPVIQCWSK